MIRPAPRTPRALLLAAVASGLFLAGCWHQIPLEKRGLVPVLAIDRSPGGGYEVTAAIIFPPGLPSPGPAGQGGGGSAIPLLVRSASAPTVMRAIAELTPTAYLHLDFTHLQAVIVSEAVARSGLAPALQYIARSLEFAQVGWLLVAQGQSAASLVLDTEKDLPQPNEVLSETVRWSRMNTPYVAARLFTAFKEMPLAGIQFATAGVASGPSGTPQTVPVAVTGVALFRGDRLVGWLEGDAALGWAAAMKSLRHQTLSLPTPTQRVEMELAGSSRRVRVLASPGAAPTVALSLLVTAHLTEAGRRADFWAAGNRAHDIESLAAQALEGDVTSALREAQADGADVFGLGEYVRLHDPTYWDTVRADWNTGAFPRLSVAVAVRVSLTSVGEILCPLLGSC